MKEFQGIEQGSIRKRVNKVVSGVITSSKQRVGLRNDLVQCNGLLDLEKNT